MNKSWRVLLPITGVILVLALVSCVFLLFALYSHGGERGINQERAMIIVKAVYEYQNDQGAFPVQLKDLAPDYLDQVPRTFTGQPFFYNTDSVSGFFIMFELGQHYGCGYSDQSKVWECGGGD
jgi:hypothetical protein